MVEKPLSKVLELMSSAILSLFQGQKACFGLKIKQARGRSAASSA
jgi:hypothetical protein